MHRPWIAALCSAALARVLDPLTLGVAASLIGAACMTVSLLCAPLQAASAVLGFCLFLDGLRRVRNAP